ncbi:NAD(P)-dependent oxidoreductase, partial [Staphylococcus saprophyticus]|uniref:NAD(P)-dependent oxidoreductase n=1 Tax=Staphylococcus saprophyticus TaxID=29385 RepID=UPI003703EAF3
MPPNHHYTTFLTYPTTINQPIQNPHILTLHIPPTNQNHYFFHQTLFNQFKPPSLFINSPPPTILKTTPLIHALHPAFIKRAALHTYQAEKGFFP